MGIGNIRFGGIGSGLDTGAIIEALLGIERAKIFQLEDEQGGFNQKITLFGQLKGLTKTLQDKVTEFTGTDGTVLGHSVTASEEGTAAFSITGSPTEGSHTLQITQLAQTDKYALSQAATNTDADATLSSGTLSFDYDGTSYSVTGAYSLNELVGEINTATGGEVRASVINVGTTTTPDYQLILAGDDTGADFDIQNLSISIAELDTTTQLSTAQNASATVDGLVVQRSTNEFVDVINGVTFQAQTVNASAITVDVGLDTDKTKSNIREFVAAYNSVVNFIGTQSTYSEESGTGGALFGDSALRTIRNTLYNAAYNADPTTVANDPDGFSTLSLVGLDLQSDGTIKIDESKLDDKLAQDSEQLDALFTDSTTGVFSKLDAGIDVLLKGPGADDASGENNGVFGTRTTTLKSTIERLDDDIERLQLRLEKTEESLVLKFANLEALLAQLNSQSSALSQTLG